jgi:protein ImuA
MVEVLQAQPGQHDWQLLLPALSVLCATKPVLLVGAANRIVQPFGPGLAARGLNAQRLLWVDSPDPAAQLWSAEQGLRCPGVAAVLAWLPQDRRVAMPALRRLHLAAQTHGHALFVFRPSAVAQDASPAPLRVLLEPQAADGAADASLRLRILKRRGPPLTQALDLPAQPDAIVRLLAASRARRELGRARPLPMQILLPSLVPGLGGKVINLPLRSHQLSVVLT